MTQQEPDTVTALTEPAGGVPTIVDTPQAWSQVVEDFAAGTGPLAADAERASGFRYGQATYLVQLKRAGAGLALIDTSILTDLSALNDAVGDCEWVLHAASQDLPGLHTLGLQPATIFDTELAARLLGWPKVGLAAVVEQELGLVLAKEHSAQDWSVRPLPHSWLVYAALDVEVLIELRDGLAAHLESAGKREWAAQEFEAVRTAPPAQVKEEPWRRTSGCHLVRDQRGLAVVKHLWEARDREARRRDIAPGRVLRDAAIIAAALARPESVEGLLAVPEWQSKGTRRRAQQWYPAVADAMRLPEAKLPSRRGPRIDGPPQARTWREKRPDAWARLSAARAHMQQLSDTHQIPVENLLQPEALRRVCWDFNGHDRAWVEQQLRDRGARAWQVELCGEVIALACVNPPETTVEQAVEPAAPPPAQAS